MATPHLTQLRLKAFKSFRDAVMPIDPVTIITGRNSSGKSNALDAVAVLSRLATGQDLGEALDGRRQEGGPIRGGSVGCAPHGQRAFSIGCTVKNGADVWDYDVQIGVQPELRILSERLVGPGPAVESGRVEQRYLIYTTQQNENAAGLQAEIHNGKRGTNPIYSFRDNRLVAAQVPLRINPRNSAEEAVTVGAQAVLTTLLGAFDLDPVPHLMRSYVPQRDSELRRTAENLPAALAQVKREDPEVFARIVGLVREVTDDRLQDISIESSQLGDVTIALRERFGRRLITTPAREMSDGLLRFLAIVTALLTSRHGLDLDPGISVRDFRQGVLVVIEELENGLHPSQAAKVLDLVLGVSASDSRGASTQVVFTTHSPAILNELTGRANRSVLVCYRNELGHSKFARMVELPGYTAALARGEIGDAVSEGRLIYPDAVERDTGAFRRLIGLE